MMKKIKVLIPLLVLLIVCSSQLLASDQILSYVSGKTGFLLIKQQEIIRIHSDYKGLSISERIKLVEARLQKLAATGGIDQGWLRISERNGNIGLTYRNNWLVSVDPQTAYLHRMTQRQLAEVWEKKLISAFAELSKDYTVIETSSGTASWYGKEFRGRKTANGEKFDETKFTAAHRSLPFGTRVRVTNIANNASVIVIINDRGPWIKNRVIDLSWAAARAIGISGLGKVKIEVLKV